MLDQLLPDTSTFILGIGVYVIVFALCFLVSLPLIGERHNKGEDVTPLIWRIVLINLALGLVLTVAGFWIVDFYSPR